MVLWVSICPRYSFAIHMCKIYMGMYHYIYVNILRYVKRATSKVHCVHMNFITRGIFQLTSVFSWYLLSKDVYLQLFGLTKQEESASRSSSGIKRLLWKCLLSLNIWSWNVYLLCKNVHSQNAFYQWCNLLNFVWLMYTIYTYLHACSLGSKKANSW